MRHVAKDSDSNDEIEPDAGVVVDENKKKTSQFVGVTQINGREFMNNAGVKNHMTLESDDIDTIESSKKIFSKRDHVKDSDVRRFQHVSSFTSDETLMN